MIVRKNITLRVFKRNSLKKNKTRRNKFIRFFKFKYFFIIKRRTIRNR